MLDQFERAFVIKSRFLTLFRCKPILPPCGTGRIVALQALFAGPVDDKAERHGSRGILHDFHLAEITPRAVTGLARNAFFDGIAVCECLGGLSVSSDMTAKTRRGFLRIFLEFSLEFRSKAPAIRVPLLIAQDNNESTHDLS